MNINKKINVNFSSLVGLKAELLRKQLEVNEVKLKSEINHTVPKVKKKPKKVKEKNTEENAEKTEYIEDVNTHKKSKLMLEAKARLYKRLKKSKHNNENFLVDFMNKSDESEEETLSNIEKEDNNAMHGNEDDWIEYEDCFGRTRKCLREDLSLMQEKDNLIKQQIVNKRDVDSKIKDKIIHTMVTEEKEPEIEIMRRKWEEQMQKLTDKSNIHYQDVLFDEARAHGVGYYAFSQDEEERIKQQENLFNLRKETERKQRESKELKELRDRMEYNRIKAAKMRQRIRAGLPIELEEEEVKETEKAEPHVGMLETTNKEENCNKEEENETLEKENKIEALRELLGKRGHWTEMSQEEWVHKCRKIRINEFGPVYDNFKSDGYLVCNDDDKKLDSSDTITQNKLETNDNENIDSYNIPLPPTAFENYVDTENDTDLQTSIITNCEAKSTNIAPNGKQNEIEVNRNIDEASIAAGLRYLREEFEKGRNM
ncbi:coiled-coil domain-containing protein 174 [Augochlora pura]